MTSIQPASGHWPREHGAWAQLLIPLAAALLVGEPGRDALLLVLASVALFAAHEPLLVLRGLRGKRIQAAESRSARRHLSQRVGLAVLAGVVALTHAPQTVAVAALAVLPLGLGQLALTLTGKHKSLTGESLAGGVLAAAALPVALAADVPVAVALQQALTWAAGFVLMTTAVHACKARALHQPKRRRLEALALLLAVAGLVVALARIDSRPLAPMASIALVLAVAPIHLRHMTRVGWLLALASMAALALQIHLWHAGGP